MPPPTSRLHGFISPVQIFPSRKSLTLQRCPRQRIQVFSRRQNVIIAKSDPSTKSPPSTPVTPPPSSPRSNVKADVLWTLAWISVAAITAGGTYVVRGTDRALEFVTAYIVEYSLSVDNLFVFLLIFSYFKIPRAQQLRVLEWGLIGAMVLRLGMIVVGEALIQQFAWVTLVFGGILVVSAVKLLAEGEEEEDDIGDSGVVRLARRVLPVGNVDGERFWTKEKDKWMATPLLLVLVCVELSDVIFAVDSVPAVLGVSKDVFVVYMSNVLAIVGLRNLFFVLSDAISELRFVRQALAAVLGFVGAKMIGTELGWFNVGTAQSLGIVVSMLGGGIGASLAFPEKK